MPQLSITITARLQARLQELAGEQGFSTVEEWLTERLVAQAASQEQSAELKVIEEEEQARSRAAMTAHAEVVRDRYRNPADRRA